MLFEIKVNQQISFEMELIGRAVDCVRNIDCQSLKYCNRSRARAGGNFVICQKYPAIPVTQSTALPSNYRASKNKLQSNEFLPGLLPGVPLRSWSFWRRSAPRGCWSRKSGIVALGSLSPSSPPPSRPPAPPTIKLKFVYFGTFLVILI